MKKHIKSLFIFVLLLFPLFANGEGDVSVKVRIEGADATILNETLSIQEGCQVQDSQGNQRTVEGYKAICAVQKALDLGRISNLNAVYYDGIGLFIDSINGISTPEDWSKTWNFRYNSDYADTGIDSTLVNAGGEVMLTYGGPWPIVMEPLKVSGPATLAVGQEGIFTALVFNDSTNAFESYQGAATFVINGTEFESLNGQIVWAPVTAQDNAIFVEADGKTRSENFEVTSQTVAPLYRVISDKEVVVVGEQFIVNSQWDQFATGDWQNLANVTVGVILADSPSTVEVVTLAVDESGNAVFSVNGSGLYRVGIKEQAYSPYVEIRVQMQSSGTGVSGASTSIPVVAFDATKAIQFLLSNQKEDGSFGQDMFTDWSALALAAGNGDIEKVKNYISAQEFKPGSVTDYERRAMARLALGLDAADYVEKITAAFDGNQIGDSQLINDDIFGLLVLRSAGYGESEDIVQKTVQFILSKQNADGSWIGGVDMTAAAVQSLVLTQLNVQTALDRAKTYLLSQQKDDGGFGDVYGTSWGLQAIGALGESAVKNGKTPSAWLALMQSSDGGMLPESSVENRVWATAYAIPAVLGKPWGKILSQSFSQQNTAVSSDVPAAVSAKTSAVYKTDAVLDGAQLKAEVLIPEGTRVKAINGFFDGVIALFPERQKGRVELVAIDSEIEGTGAGYLNVFPGEGVGLEFDKPIEVKIPVFGNEGEELNVYARSEPDSNFKLLAVCKVQNSICSVQTNHLSEFLAVRPVIVAPAIAVQNTEIVAEEAVNQEATRINEQIASIQADIAVLQVALAAIKESERVAQVPAQQDTQLAAVEDSTAIAAAKELSLISLSKELELTQEATALHVVDKEQNWLFLALATLLAGVTLLSLGVYRFWRERLVPVQAAPAQQIMAKESAQAQ